MNNGPYFELVSVARRLTRTELVIYRCLKKLPAGGYFVQNADRVRDPVDRKMLRDQEAIFWELLIEHDESVERRFFPTLEQAIEAFHESFSDPESGEPESGEPS